MNERRLMMSLTVAVLAVALAIPLFQVDYARARACVNQFIRNTSTAEPTCDTVKIDTDTDKKFGGVAVTADGTELNYNDTATPGTSVASKTLVLGANKNTDVLALPVSGLKIGAGAGTAMDATAAELNTLAGVVAGTASASKAAVLGANKNLDTLAIADGGLKLGAGAGIAVTATAVELNETLLTLDIADLSVDTTYYMVMPHAGTITKIWSVIDGAVLTADVTITANIGATPITNGVVTITTAASAAGDIDSATPSAANTVTAGQAINLVVAGGGAGGSPRGHVAIVLTR